MLVDQYGNQIVRPSFNRSTENRGVDRPWVPTKLDNIDKLIPSYERNTLVAVSRMLIENWGPARSIARQISMYSVGKAWKPSLDTTDESIKLEAETVIREQFCRMATLKGEDLSTVLYHIAHLTVRDGECFYLLTEWESGFPAIQIIPTHRIGQREWGEVTLKDGQYRGYKIKEGVIRNKYGVPIAYRLMGETPDQDMDISSSFLKHSMDSDYPEAGRGYPALSHALNDGRDALQAHEWERLNMLARSSHTMIEHNESGIPENPTQTYFNEDGGSTTPSTSSQITTNTLFGGIYKTVRAGSGFKLESVKHDTPGETWESFGDRMIRKLCSGVPWPFSFIWEGSSRGGGTAERRDIMQARQTVEDMQAILEKEARIIIGYAFKKLVKLGRVKDTPDWWRWSFSKPPKLTVDDGRVSKSNLELWRAGVLNDEDLLSDLGKDHDEHYRSRFNRAADKELMFMEAEKSKGVKLDQRIKGMFTPNDMKETESEETQEREEKEDED